METKVRREYHENGKIKYEEVICVLPKNKEHLYQSKMRSPDGHYFIFVKKTKHYNNGQFAWELNYDKDGECVKKEKPTCHL